jgi:chloramphenicol 3-O-phosphotransferase
MAGSVIVVSGPPGAGKSSVARLLVESATGPAAWIEGDTFWRFFTKPPEGQNPGEGVRILVPSLMFTARMFARGGYEAIVDFSVPPGFLAGARKRVGEYPLQFVILRPTEEVCASRNAARGEGDYSRYHEFYRLFEGTPEYDLDDPSGDPQSIATRLREQLKSGRYRVQAAPPET